MECERPWVIAVFAIILFALGALFVSGGAFGKSNQYILNSESQIPQISVQGSAQMITEPDQAKIYLYITTLKETAKLSQEENAKINDLIIASLLAEGVLNEDIKTTSYSVYEKKEWEEDKNGTYGYVSKGYETSHRIEVTVKNLDSAGAISDKIVANGGLIEYVQFGLSDAKRKTIEESLISDAVSNARSSASKIAQAAGSKLGKLQSASYGAASYYYPSRYDYAAISAKESYDSAEPMTSFSSGEITVSIAVSTSFAVE